MICTVDPTYALVLDGEAAYLKLPPLDFGGGRGYTVEAMVRFDSLERGACIFELGIGETPDERLAFYTQPTRELVLELRRAGASHPVVAAAALAEKQWTHLAVTVADNGQTTLYKNGQAVKVGVLPRASEVARRDNFVGKSRTGCAMPLHGQVAEVRIWSCVRNGAQLAQAIGALASRDRAHLLHYFRLDDGDGTRPRDGAAMERGARPEGAEVCGARWLGTPVDDSAALALSAERRVYWQIFLDEAFAPSGHSCGSCLLPAGSGAVIIEHVARGDSTWRLGYTYDEAGRVAAFFCRDDILEASELGAPLRAPCDSGMLSRAALLEDGGSYIQIGAAQKDNPRVDWSRHRDARELLEEPRPPSLSSRIFPDVARPVPSLGLASRLGFAQGSYTVEVWLRGCDLDPDCEYAVLGNDSAAEPLHFMIRGLRAGLRMHRRELIGTTVLANNKWHHIAWSYDAVAHQMYLFIDGALDAAAAAPPFVASGAMTLGSYRGTSALGPRRPFQGNLDEVRIFSRTRSPRELRAERGLRLSGAEPGLCAVYRLDGRAEQALEFSAGNVELPPMRIDFTQGLTLEAWVHYKQLQPWARIVDLGNGPSSNNIVLTSGDSGGELALLVYVGGTARQLVAAGALQEGCFAHVAATIDSDGNGKLYKDGALLAAGALAVPASVPRSSNYLGKSNWSGDAPLHGTLSEVRLWNRARAPEELRRDQYRRLCGSEAGLCGNWPLDEGSGAMAHDTSFYGHGGRLQPGTAFAASGLLLGVAAPLPLATRSVTLARPPRARSNRRMR